MYFWSALIAFGAVAYSVNSASVWIVLAIVALSAVGLLLLLMPRFTPKLPRWTESFVPPRYRRGRRTAVSAAAAPRPGEEPCAPAPAGLHGATALGARRLPERRRVGSRG
jgi:UDP-GlcNAc:undecaprenyl-phosphate GlcNAc-1-phosphate transferase